MVVPNRNPFDDLPDDLLLHILPKVWGDDHDLWARLRPRVFTSHVCQRWRRLVLGHTALWSDLAIAQGTGVALLHSVLPRSAQHTLNLWIKTAYREPRDYSSLGGLLSYLVGSAR